MPTLTNPPAVPMFVKRPPDTLACFACGIAVPEAEVPPEEAVDVISYGKLNHIGIQTESKQLTYNMTRCASCRAVRDRARALIQQFPSVAARLGSVAEHRVECALQALDLLDAKAPTIASARAVMLLVHHLSVPGGLARWSCRFSPFTRADAGDWTCSTERWAHVFPHVREDARQGLANLLAESVEIDVPCPTRGCLFCGVPSIRTVAARSVDAWSSAAAQPGLLGGRNAPEKVKGHLCPTCTRALVDVGAMGSTAMERSLLRHHGLSNRGAIDRVIPGLAAWQITGTAPTTRPWGHIENLDEVIRALSTGG